MRVKVNPWILPQSLPLPTHPLPSHPTTQKVPKKVPKTQNTKTLRIKKTAQNKNQMTDYSDATVDESSHIMWKARNAKQKKKEESREIAKSRRKFGSARCLRIQAH